MIATSIGHEKDRQIGACNVKTSRKFRESMYSSAMRLRRVGFMCRLAVAACLIYIGLIVSLVANPINGMLDRAMGEAARFCAFSHNDAPAPFQDVDNVLTSITDIDDTDDAPLDLGCDNNDQTLSQLCIVDLDAVTLRTPEVIRILRVPVRCFYCLHEHLRERGPPTLSS